MIATDYQDLKDAVLELADFVLARKVGIRNPKALIAMVRAAYLDKALELSTIKCDRDAIERASRAMAELGYHDLFEHQLAAVIAEVKAHRAPDTKIRQEAKGLADDIDARMVAAIKAGRRCGKGGLIP